MDPFKIREPTCVSFSGGRSSALMLYKTLVSNDGLPDDSVVCFQNTGKEHEATLRFVRDCADQWGVTIHWIEFTRDDPGYRVVDFDSASRNGEPFEELITKKTYLPNPIARFCTAELKVRCSIKWLKDQGWDEWDKSIGIRADEQRRVSRMRARPQPEASCETIIMPLADAGIAVQDVTAFWETQPFDLEIPTVKGKALLGNCDLCFLKGAKQIQSIIAHEPARADWWAEQEARIASSGKYSGDGARFRKDRPGYADMKRIAATQGDMFGTDDDQMGGCFCGD